MIEGKVIKYTENADNINTDVIWPGKYTYIQMDDSEMKKHAMETFDPDFSNKLIDGSILVIGKNFGCGSSREQAVKALKVCGVKAIIAKSFARIYYRNAINLGMPLIESEEIVEAINNRDTIEINLEEGYARVNGIVFTFAKYPEFVFELMRHDGLINMIKDQTQKKKMN